MKQEKEVQLKCYLVTMLPCYRILLPKKYVTCSLYRYLKMLPVAKRCVITVYRNRMGVLLLSLVYQH